MSSLAINGLFQQSMLQGSAWAYDSNVQLNCIFDKIPKQNSKVIEIPFSSTYSELKKHPNLKISKNVDICNMKEPTQNALFAAAKWAENNGYNITVTSGFRTAEYQNKLFKKEPDIADSPEHSMHCKGLAFDIGLYPENSKQKIRDPKVYMELARELKNQNFDIYNGREFPDAPKDNQWQEAWHFQTGQNDGFLFQHENK